MRPGLAKIIEKVRIWRYFWKSWNWPLYSRECFHIDYADTWSLKRVHWLSKSQGLHCSNTYYGCEDMLELDTGVAWASLIITRIQPWVAPTSKIQWLLATLHNTGWMDHGQVRHWSFEAIPILDPVDVEEDYSHIASCYHSVQWHVPSHGWRYASIGLEENPMEGRLVLRHEVSSKKSVQI